MFVRKTLTGLVCSSVLLSASAFAETFSTRFEFTDTSGEFTLNTAPNRVTFTGGEAKFISVPGLYRSGQRAFLFEDGVASITFETAPQSVTLYLRNRERNVDSTVNVFEIGNAEPVASIVGTNTSFTELTYTSEVGIDRIEAINNTAIYAGIDDFSFTPFVGEVPAPGPVIDPIPEEPAPEQLLDPIPESVPLSDISVELELVTQALTDPLLAITAPDVANFTFIAEQSGNIWSLNETNDELINVLSVADRIVTESERGLIGLAFHPDFASNGLVYTYTSEPVDGEADFDSLPDDASADHYSVIAEWQASTNETTGITFDTESRRVLFRVAQPQDNHNGGSLVFDQLNNLIVALGDGGSADDQGFGHSEGGNGQDTTNVLGTLLRIDPLTRNSNNGNYGIPGDNPFLTTESVPDEIFAVGLRNPFKTYFDQDNNLLYVADVGQNNVEEINIVESGDNLGWPEREGPFGFFNNGDDEGYVFDQSPNADFKEPIAAYDHDTGIAIIGGVVYTGDAVDELTNRYIFAELFGKIFFLDDGNEVTQLQITDDPIAEQAILGFGEDTSNQLYVLTRDFASETGNVYRVNNQEVVEPAPEPEPVTPEPAPEVAPDTSSSSGGGLGGMLLLMFAALVVRVRSVKK